MANRTQYQIVGRYMSGKEVTGYHLHSLESGKQGRYTKDQVCYLVGRDQVTNCSGQLYQDKVLLRGVGVSLESLPVQREDGTLTKTENVGKSRRGDTATDVMTKMNVLKAIVNGRNVIGYVIGNSGGATKNVSRQVVIGLASQKKLGNVGYQNYNGKPILRGIGIELDKIPTITAQEAGIMPTKKEAEVTKPSTVTKTVGSDRPKVMSDSGGTRQETTRIRNQGHITTPAAKMQTKSNLDIFKSVVPSEIEKYNSKHEIKLVSLLDEGIISVDGTEATVAVAASNNDRYLYALVYNATERPNLFSLIMGDQITGKRSATNIEFSNANLLNALKQIYSAVND